MCLSKGWIYRDALSEIRHVKVAFEEIVNELVLNWHLDEILSLLSQTSDR